MGLAAEDPEEKTEMIDGESGGAAAPSQRLNDLKTHRTATSLRAEKGGEPEAGRRAEDPRKATRAGAFRGSEDRIEGIALYDAELWRGRQ